MNRFIAAVIIFVFFWAVVGPVFVGILTLFALSTGLAHDISQGAGLWTVQAGSLLGTFLGLFFAAQRVWKNAPWRLTIFKKSVIFGCAYYVAQALWLLLLFFVSGPEGPPMALNAVDFIVRFPLSLFGIGSKGPLMLHYAGLFISSIFWAAVFHLAANYVKKRRAGLEEPPPSPLR